MNKIYNSPELNISQFNNNDVITLSVVSTTGAKQGIYNTTGKTSYGQLN